MIGEEHGTVHSDMITILKNTPNSDYILPV